MLYIVTDFFKNFLAAINAEDTILLTDLIIDEVAKLIVFDRGKTIEIIRKAKADKKLGSKPSDNDIVQVLIAEIPKNKVLVDSISDLVILNNSDKNNSTGKETVPANKRKEYVKKALVMFIIPDNEMLLKKKTASHLKVRDMNFAANAEVVNLTGKQKTVIVLKTAFVTSAILTGGFFIVKEMIKRGVFKKKDKEPEAAATPDGGNSNSDSNEE